MYRTFGTLQREGIYPHKIFFLENIIRLTSEVFGKDSSISISFTQALRNKGLNTKVHGWSLLHLCIYQFESLTKPLPKALQNMLLNDGMKVNKSRVKCNLRNLINQLLDNGADVNILDDWGRTPIYFTSDSEILTYLIRRGARINFQNVSIHPLHVIVSLSDRWAIELLKQNASSNVLDRFGRLPLHCAVANHPSFAIYNVRALLFYYPRGTEISDFFGFYPLSYALMFGNEELIDLLLQYTSVEVRQILRWQIETHSIHLPDNEKDAQQNKQIYGFYDALYNIPPCYKVYVGFGKGKFVKKQQSQQKLGIVKEIEDTYKGYNLKPDNHGKKHCYQIKDENARERIKNWGQKPAVFHPDCILIYNQLLVQVIKAIVDDSCKTSFIDMGKIIGWDKGHPTSIIELYYGAAGSHIRPKLDSEIPAGQEVLQLN